MRVATYVLTAAAGQGETTAAEEILVSLATHAKGRGWDVALEIAAEGLWPESRSEGRIRLLQAIHGREVQAVLVRSLSQLARSLRHLTDLGDFLARHRLRELRAAGKAKEAARAQAIAARGGPNRGGRPSTSIDDTALAAEWKVRQQIARRRDSSPSLSAIARNLHVSRSRVLSRLREIGLITEERSFRCITPPAASSQEKTR